MDDRDLHGDEGERLTDDVREDVRDEARAGAREAFEAGKARTRSFLEDQKGAIAGRVGGIAEALRSTARDLEARGDGAGSSAFVEGAARRLEQLSRSLRERDVRGLISDGEAFARRSPGVFVGSAVAAGFLLARFLKSSGESQRGREEREPFGRGVLDSDEPYPDSPEPRGYADRPTGRTC